LGRKNGSRGFYRAGRRKSFLRLKRVRLVTRKETGSITGEEESESSAPRAWGKKKYVYKDAQKKHVQQISWDSCKTGASWTKKNIRSQDDFGRQVQSIA